MAETEELTAEETVVETPNEVQEEPQVEEKPETEEEKTEKKEGFIKNLLNKLGTSDTEPPEEAGDDVSDKFTEAALAQSWTEEDIKEFAANYSNEELEEMIPHLVPEEPQPDSDPVKEATKPQEDKPKEPDNEALAALKAEVENLKKDLADAKQIKEERTKQDIITQVNRAFDKAAEKFEVFGKTEELPKFPAGPRKGQYIPTSPALKARNQVLEVADALIAGGMSVDRAMDEAINGYKGRNLEKDVQRSFVKQLKRKEKQLSGKRMGKETVKTYEDEESRKEDVVRSAARTKGIEL